MRYDTPLELDPVTTYLSGWLQINLMGVGGQALPALKAIATHASGYSRAVIPNSSGGVSAQPVTAQPIPSQITVTFTNDQIVYLASLSKPVRLEYQVNYGTDTANTPLGQNLNFSSDLRPATMGASSGTSPVYNVTLENNNYIFELNLGEPSAVQVTSEADLFPLMDGLSPFVAQNVWLIVPGQAPRFLQVTHAGYGTYSVGDIVINPNAV